MFINYFRDFFRNNYIKPFPDKALFKSFIFMFLPAAFLIVVCLIFIFRFQKEAYIHEMAQTEVHHVELQHTIVVEELKNIVADLLFLSDTSEIRGFTSTNNDTYKSVIEDNFKSFSMSKQIYDQIRFIDLKGDEQCRVNAGPFEAFIIPQSELQNKGHRYYFNDTIKLNVEEVFISDFDLNLENKKVETPYKPMIRFGTPVISEDSEKIGVIILNYLGDYLLKQLNAHEPESYSHNIMINTEGYYMNGITEESEWGFMLDHDLSFKNDFPQEWLIIKNRESGQIRTNNGILTFQKIHPQLLVNTISNPDTRLATNGRTWTIITWIQPDSINAYGNSIKPLYYIIGSVGLFVTYLVILIISTLNMSQKDYKKQLEFTNSNLLVAMDRLREAQEQLVQSRKLASLGSIVAGVSHEVNTPLGIGITTASYLKDTIKDLEKGFTSHTLTESNMREHLKNMNFSADFVIENLDKAAQLLTKFKVASEAQNFQDHNAFDLHDFILMIIHSIKRDPKNKDFNIHLVNNESVIIQCSPNAIQQVLYNLLENSIEHGYNNESGNIAIGYTVVGDTVTLSVEDQGKGIDPENKSRIFDPFFTTRLGQGSNGLGLNIVYNLVVNTLQGEINIESESGRGSIAKVTFPIDVQDNN